MNELVAYLNDVKRLTGIKNDRQLSIAIGITTPAMSGIMAGVSVLTDEHCIKVAELTGDDPAKVIALAHKVKASEKACPHWEKILKALSPALNERGHVRLDILCKIILQRARMLVSPDKYKNTFGRPLAWISTLNESIAALSPSPATLKLLAI